MNCEGTIVMPLRVRDLGALMELRVGGGSCEAANLSLEVCPTSGVPATCESAMKAKGASTEKLSQAVQAGGVSASSRIRAQTAAAGVCRAERIARLKAASERATQLESERQQESSKRLRVATDKLKARLLRNAARAGIEPETGAWENGKPFPSAPEVELAAAKLRAIAFEARKLGPAAVAVQRAATTLSHTALNNARMLQRSAALEAAWRERQAAAEAVAAQSADTAARKPESRAGCGDCEPEGLSSDVALQVEKAHRIATLLEGSSSTQHEVKHAAAHAHAAAKEPLDGQLVLHPPASCKAPAGDAKSARQPAGDAKSARQANQLTYWNVMGGLMIEPVAYQLLLRELPPAIPVPAPTVCAMCSSLAPVLAALNRGVDGKSHEYEAAKSAYRSWSDSSWFDARVGSMRTKPAKGWTTEQYGLCGFAGLYAQALHIARVATVRQVMCWVLESSPGLPSDGPLSFGDLGAGTCAASLGARYALRDYSGGEHPFRCWPIDVASSSACFEEGFKVRKRSRRSEACGLGQP